MPAHRALVALVLVASAAVGCSTAQGQSPPRLTQAEQLLGCPLGVSGATANVADIPGGVSVDFTSTSKPEEMRERANDAAAQHGPGTRMGRGHDGHHGEGGDHGLMAMQLPAMRSVAEDIEGGARLRLVASDPADTETLRTKVRERVAAMNASTCK